MRSVQIGTTTTRRTLIEPVIGCVQSRSRRHFLQWSKSMPLFKCSKCNCVENTACGHYWMQHANDKPVLCSECGSGEWHGKFPKKHAAGMRVGEDGFLYELSYTPTHTKLVGVIAEDGSVSARATGESNA